MKKVIALVLAVLMMTALCACGAQNPTSPAPTAAPVVSEAPEATEQPATPPEGMSSTLPGAEANVEEASEVNEARELALSLVNEDVSLLIEKIGEPISSDYAPSCLGSGQDGELVFDGFTVYTYKTEESETITDVE